MMPGEARLPLPRLDNILMSPVKYGRCKDVTQSEPEAHDLELHLQS